MRARSSATCAKGNSGLGGLLYGAIWKNQAYSEISTRVATHNHTKAGQSRPLVTNISVPAMLSAKTSSSVANDVVILTTVRMNAPGDNFDQVCRPGSTGCR